MNLYIYSYNNYYNRIVKKAGDTIEDYADFLHYGPVEGVYGFTPSDGVNTQQLLGSNISSYDGKGDYLIAHNPETNEIDSRWFIMDCTRTRQGQWQLTLHRDLLVDFYEPIIKAPAMIEKANLSVNDNLIFTKEGMTFNQIKTSEYLLKDQSDCPWAVIYYSLNPNTVISGTVYNNKLSSLPHIEIDETNIEDWKFWKYSNLSGFSERFYGVPSEGYYKINARKGSNNGDEYRFSSSMVDGETDYVQYYPKTYKSQGVYFPNANTAQEQCLEIRQQIQPQLSSLNHMVKSVAPFSTQAELEELLSYNGKLIQVGLTGLKYYSVTVEEATTDEERLVELPEGSNIQLAIKQAAIDSGMTVTSQSSEANFEFEVTATSYYIWLREEKDEYLTYDVTNDTTRITPSDVPYGILALPIGDLKVKNATSSTIFSELTTNKEYNLNLISKMWTQEAEDIYDIQILPYCPCQELITKKGEITLTNSNQYSIIYSQAQLGSTTRTPCGIILNVPKARFTFDIPLVIQRGQSPIHRKVNNECDKWRLASPNYSNYFDFSVEENNGIQYFNVDCEYKPYTPYIHLNPNFSTLYGKDFNDPRGLVLGGEFSITNVQDKWEQYELQNKNYQNIFNRQIESMELNRTLNAVSDFTSGALGSVNTAAAGFMVGGVPGAIIGGVAGLAGGMTDAAFNLAKANDQIELQRETFNYQLGNIQAMPHTIGKLSAFNNNNKLFPVLEYYTCTQREKDLFVNAMAYNGMTVMATGYIKDYLPNTWTYSGQKETIRSKNYVRAQIIRLEDLGDDFHVLNSITRELKQGAYYE